MSTNPKTGPEFSDEERHRCVGRKHSLKTLDFRTEKGISQTSALENHVPNIGLSGRRFPGVALLVDPCCCSGLTLNRKVFWAVSPEALPGRKLILVGEGCSLALLLLGDRGGGLSG